MWRGQPFGLGARRPRVTRSYYPASLLEKYQTHSYSSYQSVKPPIQWAEHTPGSTTLWQTTFSNPVKAGDIVFAIFLVDERAYGSGLVSIVDTMQSNWTLIYNCGVGEQQTGASQYQLMVWRSSPLSASGTETVKTNTVTASLCDDPLIIIEVPPPSTGVVNGSPSQWCKGQWTANPITASASVSKPSLALTAIMFAQYQQTGTFTPVPVSKVTNMFNLLIGVCYGSGGYSYLRLDYALVPPNPSISYDLQVSGANSYPIVGSYAAFFLY